MRRNASLQIAYFLPPAWLGRTYDANCILKERLLVSWVIQTRPLQQQPPETLDHDHAPFLKLRTSSKNSPELYTLRPLFVGTLLQPRRVTGRAPKNPKHLKPLNTLQTKAGRKHCDLSTLCQAWGGISSDSLPAHIQVFFFRL